MIDTIRSIAISVIIPIYNSELFLSRCIESVLHQTFKNFEIILINDGSLDSSLQICKQYAARDDRIRIISQPNAGVSVARNNGINHAIGEFVTFVDSDDFLEPCALSVLYKAINNGEYDLIIGSIYRVRMNGSKTPLVMLPCSFYTSRDFATFFCEKSNVCLLRSPWSKLYRRSIIINNNICFPAGVTLYEDTIFDINYYRKMSRTAVLDTVIYNYQENSESATASIKVQNFKDLLSLEQNLRVYYTVASIDNDHNFLASQIINEFIILTRGYLKNNISYYSVYRHIKQYINYSQIREHINNANLNNYPRIVDKLAVIAVKTKSPCVILIILSSINFSAYCIKMVRRNLHLR